MVVVLLALLACGGWWVARTSVVPPDAVASLRDVVPLESSPRRDAGRLPTMASAATRPIGGAAASSAPGTAEDRSRCGLDQKPDEAEVSTDDDEAAAENHSTPAGPAYLAEVAHIDTALRTSSDPFDRAVAVWAKGDELPAPVHAQDALVELATTTTDARVYALAFRNCRESALPDKDAAEPTWAAGSRCSQLDTRRWIDLEPGNGVPWMFAYARAVAVGNPTAQQDALTHMATATRFDDHLYAAAAAVAAHASHDERGLAAASDRTEETFRKTVGLFDPIRPLMVACQAKAGSDANRAQECRAIGEAMAEHGDSLLMQAYGSVFIMRATGDPARRDRYRAERMEMEKQAIRLKARSECQVVRDGLKEVLRSAEVGEVQAKREQLQQLRREARP
jgi:hypothetical protein